MNYCDIQQLFDTLIPFGQYRCYWKSHYLSGLGNDAIDLILEGNATRRRPTRCRRSGASAARRRVSARRTRPSAIARCRTCARSTRSGRRRGRRRQHRLDARLLAADGAALRSRPHLPQLPGFGEEGEELVRRSYGAELRTAGRAQAQIRSAATCSGSTRTSHRADREAGLGANAAGTLRRGGSIVIGCSTWPAAPTAFRARDWRARAISCATPSPAEHRTRRSRCWPSRPGGWTTGATARQARECQFRSLRHDRETTGRRGSRSRSPGMRRSSAPIPPSRAAGPLARGACSRRTARRGARLARAARGRRWSAPARRRSPRGPARSRGDGGRIRCRDDGGRAGGRCARRRGGRRRRPRVHGRGARSGLRRRAGAPGRDHVRLLSAVRRLRQGARLRARLSVVRAGRRPVRAPQHLERAVGHALLLRRDPDRARALRGGRAPAGRRRFALRREGSARATARARSRGSRTCVSGRGESTRRTGCSTGPIRNRPSRHCGGDRACAGARRRRRRAGRRLSGQGDAEQVVLRASALEITVRAEISGGRQLGAGEASKCSRPRRRGRASTGRAARRWPPARPSTRTGGDIDRAPAPSPTPPSSSSGRDAVRGRDDVARARTSPRCGGPARGCREVARAR